MSSESTQSPPAVSVIVLNWNGAPFLARCLDALEGQTFRDYEVLVLDNASTDGSAQNLENRWPSFCVERFEQNLGFSIANNRGAQLARGRWIAFLNNDAFPEPDWLEQLMRAARDNPEFTFFSSRLVYAQAPETIQDTGDVYHVSGFAWPRDNNRPVEQAHLVSGEVFSPCAAAALYERQAFLSASGFDERFHSHLEDVDLGFRLRLRGHCCLYVPGAVVKHIGSASFGLESDRSVFQVQRNVVWAYVANMPGWLFWKYLPAHLFTNLAFLVYYSLRGQMKPVWKAKWQALRAMSELMKKRRLIQAQRKVDPSELERVLDRSWFGPFVQGRRARAYRALINREKRDGPTAGTKS